jgi:hypothetical protein
MSYQNPFYSQKSFKLYYTESSLIDEDGKTVMMDWEKPVMKKASEVVTVNGGDILNIGFGMGIVDTYIQETNPNSHTIIESHKDVINYMKENGWEDKCNCVYGRWQDNLNLGKFDGIYLDTWREERVSHIPELLDNCLKVGGVFSMWYQDWEFAQLKLSDDYEVTYTNVKNDNLIPEKQYQDGGGYIDKNLDVVVVPIVKRIKS